MHSPDISLRNIMETWLDTSVDTEWLPLLPSHLVVMAWTTGPLVRHVHNSSKDVSHSIFPNTVVQSNLVRKVMFDKEKSGIRLLENASTCHLLALQQSTYTFIKGEVIFAPGPIDNQCHRTVIRHIAVVYSTYFNLQLDGRPQMKTWRPFCRVETLQSSHQM